MEFLEIAGIGVALAMDALAVSIASGIAIKKLRVSHALRIAGSFGLFQAIMPCLGWLGGVRLRAFAQGIDHWVAFALLLLIGGKMIFESFRIGEVQERRNPLDLRVLLVLSVATSIDALAVGIGFAFLNVAILTPVLIIGLITFVMCFAGVWFGGRVGHFFERGIETVGGLILVGIGARILITHLSGVAG